MRTSHTMATRFMLIILLFLLPFPLHAAQTSRDGAYYFDQLKKGFLKVLEQHQGMINTAMDGSVKDKRLLPQPYYAKIYAQFQKMSAGKTLQRQDLIGVHDPAIIAPVLTTLLKAARIITAQSQKIINAEPDGTSRMKKFLPASFGKLRLVKDAYIKQTSLGKGKYKHRNPDNKPTPWEADALKKFENTDWPQHKGYGEYVKNFYYYATPIYTKKACLPCHGHPIGESGIYGHPKEGYFEGEVKGGLTVSLPVR